jgi:HlyD family secretion protein
MATSTKEDERGTSKFAAVLKTAPAAAAPPPVRRRRRVPRWLVGASIATVLGLGTLYLLKNTILAPATTAQNVLTEKARKADLVVSIAEDGSVESAHNKDIKCELQGGGTILWLIKDGTLVQKGDELVKFDTSTFEEKVSQQQIVVERARATMIDAEKTFEAAKIAVQEYLEGTFTQSLQTLQVTATVAKENLESSKNLLAFYNKMVRNGYVTTLQRDAQAFAVERAKLDLEVAETAITVLEKFTKEKTLVGLESTRDSAKARMASEQAAFKLEEDKLARWQYQLTKCVITAPDEGMVVYANDLQQRRGGQSRMSQVEEGAIMIERQSIIKLPDLSHMQVKCTVHESKVDSLKQGMRARIRIQEHEYQGVVTNVSNQPEPSDWFSGSVKEYAAVVSIDSDPTGLRPGMTAAIEILVANLPDVLSVPVQSVVEKRGKFYVWVNGSGGPEKRPVLLGMSNNTRIEIKDGVKDGEEVLLNPRASVEEAREEERSEEKVDVKKKFGGDKPAPVPQAGNAGPGGSPSGKGKGGGINLAALDKDGDKKISPEEAPERMKENFANLDTNKDGFLDAAEIAAVNRMIQEMQKRGGPPGGGGPGGP